ncbi:MAG: tetratricopeptide repeat protein [Armatimonadetes bacterium]|nr:tetratricopeptide repeat protein [Armatimonadota bacterium]
MKTILCLLTVLFACGAAGAENALDECMGVVRSTGDQSSWFSSCIVVGDGSWAITSWDAVTEKVGSTSTQTVRNPIFVSNYTGQAWQCEIKAINKDLNLALIKLPVKGLPAAPLAQMIDFTKAGCGTLGQLMSGDPIGNKWPTRICGIARENVGSGYKLMPSSWSASNVFVTDIGKYKWVFLINMSPTKLIPNGAIVARGSKIVGMYLNKLVIKNGEQKQVFGRCAMSTEIVSYLADHGVDSASLYSPPAPTIKRGSNAAFQYQARLYSAVTAGKPAAVLECARALVKLLPGDAQAKMMLGAALAGTGKFDEAIKALDEAEKIDPKLPALRVSRALALVGLKKKTEAETELLKAAQEAPNDTRPISALADFYFADPKTMDKAYTYAKKIITLAPDSPIAHLMLAKVAKRQKNYKESLDEIAKALQIAPEWSDAWFALGSTYEESGDKANAEKAYRKLVEKQPKNPLALMTLASFLADQNKKDEPLELLAKIRALSPAPPKELLDDVKTLEDKLKK